RLASAPEHRIMLSRLSFETVLDVEVFHARPQPPRPFVRSSLIQTEREDRRAGRDANVLLTVDGVGHRPGLPTLTRVELPERFSIPRICRDEGASGVSVEEQPTRRRHQTACRNVAFE